MFFVCKSSDFGCDNNPNSRTYSSKMPRVAKLNTKKIHNKPFLIVCMKENILD